MAFIVGRAKACVGEKGGRTLSTYLLMPSHDELFVTTYELRWPDGNAAVLKVLTDGERASVIEVKGARERVAALLTYKTSKALATGLAALALRDRAALRIEHQK